MKNDYRDLANSYISTLTPYQPGKPIEELERELGITSAIKLASNENALGPSPKAIAAAQAALLHSHVYPDGGCYALKETLSKHLHVQPDQLTIGNGSENILELVTKAYLAPGDSAVISEFAFLTIPILVQSYGGKIIRVPAKEYGHDIANMIAAIEPETRIIFIVNPNNPTGTYISHDELKKCLESIPANIIVVLDEAYNEYIQQADYPDTLRLLADFPNMVVTRTFSKIYGLAALRLGYSVSSKELADVLNRARLPFNVNSLAMIAAREALLDREHLHRTIDMNIQGMLQLEEGFKKMVVDYIPSLGNFITIDIKKNAVDLYQQLLKLGVIVRPLASYNLPSHLRVTIGTYEQNERFLKALQAVMGG